jgi:hypothetical protein
MTSEAEYRKERIERLIHELQYEIERGILNHEIEEELHWSHIIPISRAISDGVVLIEFRMRPATRQMAFMRGEPPRLKLVKSEPKS